MVYFVRLADKFLLLKGGCLHPERAVHHVVLSCGTTVLQVIFFEHTAKVQTALFHPTWRSSVQRDRGGAGLDLKMVFQLFNQTLALRCTTCVCLQFVRSPRKHHTCLCFDTPSDSCRLSRCQG